MIISNIIGGLGNQMFQCASSISLALRLGTKLKLDLSGFLNYDLHNGFELANVFDIDVAIATEADIGNLIGFNSNKLVKRLVKKPLFRYFKHKNYIVEPCFNYWDGFETLTDNVYLDGYWQSEKYFKSQEVAIKKAFTFKQALVGENLRLSNQITNTNAVSLHVRRGDYVSNTKNAFIGTCSLEYYKNAIEYTSKKISHPVFYVFSDDIAWVKRNLAIDMEHYFINHNKAKDSHFDMQLMHLCKHHIIANSSFGWWGAWLNPNKDKIVIAPKQWFASGQDDNDLIPSTWVRV